MINIIPKPYKLEDYSKTIEIDGFSIRCNNKLKDGLEIFLNEFNKYLNGNYLIDISYKKYHNIDAYTLIVNENQIIIEAGNPRALFYALRSLKQLIVIRNNKLVINCVNIFDKPKFLYRSFLIDEARHFYGKEEIKKIIDILSLLKIKYLHWHLSDDQGFRINLRKFPNLKLIGSKRLRTQLHNEYGDIYDENVYQYYYEEEEIREIIEYAKKRFITITPEFDMPGHTASFCASYPFLHCKQEQIKVFERVFGNKDILCVGKNSTYKFIEEFYDEIMKLFGECEYIHLGGDEVIPSNWNECDDCKQKMNELGIKAPLLLQDYFNDKLVNILKKYNKKLIMWADGIHENTNKDIILQYWTWKMELDSINKINNGRNTIYSPCSQNYYDSAYAELPLKTTYSRGIKLEGLTKKGRANIKGMEACVWTEYIRDNNFLEFMIFPRIHAFSESAWSFNKNLDYAEFKERLVYHYNLLKENNIKYASFKIIDINDSDASISKEFRNTNRLVEFNMDYK